MHVKDNMCRLKTDGGEIIGQVNSQNFAGICIQSLLTIITDIGRRRCDTCRDLITQPML